jgi:periplasmic protein TonB
MKLLIALTAGAGATLILTILLAALAPPAASPEGPPRALSATRVIERVPVSETPFERDRARARPRPGRGPGPGRSRPAARGEAPRRQSPAPPPARRTGAPAARTGGVSVPWPAASHWPGDALARLAVPIDAGGFGAGGGVPGGAPGGTGGTGAGGGRGDGRTALPPRPPGVTRRAVAEYAPEPPYPSSARAREQGGWVTALIHVDERGAVTSVDIAESAGGPAFEDSVRGTVGRWRFRPALRDGIPRATTIRRRFEFRMVDR